MLLKEIGNEIADVVIYCLRLCSVLDLSLIDLIEGKIELNRQNYPIEKSRGSSKKYSELWSNHSISHARNLPIL